MKNKIARVINNKTLTDIGTIGLDAILMAKGLPIPAGSITKFLANAVYSYSERVFIKKAERVLLELVEVNWHQRTNFIRSLENQGESGIDEILLAISHIETLEKCSIYGRLCRLKAYDVITVKEFRRLTKLIQDCFVDDLSLIQEFEGRGFDIRYYPLVNLGIIAQSHPVRTSGKSSLKNPENEAVENKSLSISFDFQFTELGELLLQHYNDIVE